MIYKIAIEEIVAREFEVDASSAKEALEMAVAKYKSSEFVLCPGEVQFKRVAVIEPQNLASEWEEF